jgi:prophage regulatory protein
MSNDVSPNETRDDTMQPPTTTKPLTLLRREEVKRRTGLSTSGLYKLMAEGHIPRPVRLSGCVAWPEHEIEAFIKARIQERDARVAS